MKKNFKLFIFLSIILLLIGNITFAQQQILIEPTSIDFGTVHKEAVSSQRNLRITNNGNAPLEIISIRTISNNKDNPFRVGPYYNKVSELKNIIIPVVWI